MKPSEFFREATMGGPGLDGYAFNAAVYCVDCGRKIAAEVPLEFVRSLSGTDDPLFSDMDHVPQPIFFGESDNAEHCDSCGEYLYGPFNEGEEDS